MRWLVIIASFGFLGAHGQVLDSVRGKVVDRFSSEALPGAHVKWVGTTHGATTAPDGSFALQREGDSLEVSYVGYLTRTINVKGVASITVRLSSDTTQLGPVVIRAERLIAEEFSTKKITRLEIYTNPSAKADPLLAVNSTPSATTTDESANISLRGGSPAETGIFFNNVPIHDAVRYSQLNGIGTFSIFNTALVNQVLVYPGNPPLEYGSTTSGLIAMQTDETIPARSQHTVSITLASMGAYMNRKLDNKSALTLFSNFQPSALIRAMNPEAMDRVTSFRSIDFGAHYLRKLTDKTLIKFFGYANRESYQYRMYQPTFTGDFTQEKGRAYLIGNLRHRTSSGEFSINTAFNSSAAGYDLSTLDMKVNQQDFFGSVNYQHFGNRIDLKGGFSYDTRKASMSGKFPVYFYALGEAYPVDSVTASQQVEAPEVYLYTKVNISQVVSVGGGVRKVLLASHALDYISWQGNLNLKMWKRGSITFSAGRYNKLQLITSEPGDPYRISADQYSVDASQQGKRTEWSLSLFHKRSEATQTLNKVSGVEAYVRYRFSPALRAQLSITSLEAALDRQGVRQPSPYNIAYFLRGNVEYKFAYTWTVTAVFLFRQGSYYTPVASAAFDPGLNVYAPTYGSSERLPSYNNVDLSVSKIFPLGPTSAIAFMGLSNVVNFKNVRGYSYNFDYTKTMDDLFSLRTVYFGVIINF